MALTCQDGILIPLLVSFRKDIQTRSSASQPHLFFRLFSVHMLSLNEHKSVLCTVCEAFQSKCSAVLLSFTAAARYGWPNQAASMMLKV